jgi:hypothetical protein
MDLAKWKAFLANLKAGQVFEGIAGDADWTRHVFEISVPGQITHITEDDWYYWLEVLPPRWMSGSHFCFAEGDEPFRLFWATREDQHFARQLTVDETLEFCRLTGTPAPAIEPVRRTVGQQEQALIERHLHPTIQACCGEGGF